MKQVAKDPDPLPTRGWWKALTVDAFFEQMAQLQASTYSAGTIRFTHNVFVLGLPIGEAGEIDEFGDREKIGFFRVGQLATVYGILDGRFDVRPKPE